MKKSISTMLLGIGFFLIFVCLLFGYNDIPLEELKIKYGTSPSKFIFVDGMEVHYRDEGAISDSIPIVLIHGTGSSLHTFNDWTTQLKVNHRVIRMDLPAYGLTGPFINRKYTIENYVNFIDQFLASLGIKKCVLAGNSLGGNIAWNFTSKHPNKVDRLILIDASGYPYKSKSSPLAFKLAKIPIINSIFTFITPRFIAAASVKNVYADQTKVNEQLINRYFDLTLRTGNRQAFVDKLTTKQPSSSWHKITSIKQPTLILWGAKDQLTPLEIARNFDKDLPNSMLVVFEELGHVPMEEGPLQSLKPVLTFLNKAD